MNGKGNLNTGGRAGLDVSVMASNDAAGMEKPVVKARGSRWRSIGTITADSLKPPANAGILYAYASGPC